LISDGRAEAEAMATTLRQMGVKADAYLTSPLVRTRQTAEIFADVIGHRDRVHICEALAPGIDNNQLFKDIAKLKRNEEVFLITHMPDICELARTLLHAPDLDIPFKKAAVCKIDVYSWPPAEPGTLKWFLTPRIAQAMLLSH
jgi:phosphohistidine phosphatase SixA